jgi:hypothetical protein
VDKYRIVMTGPGRGEVFRNGELVPGVTALEFRAGIDQANILILTMCVGETEIEADAAAQRDVTDISDDSRKYAAA